MKEFEITFQGQNDKNFRTTGFYEDEEAAFTAAYAMPQAKDRQYDEIGIMEVTPGPKPFSLKICYEDTALKREFTDYIIIRAKTEAQAKDYYETHYKGKRFWHYAGKLEEDGKCIYGKIMDICLAACPGFDADATAMAG